MAKQDPMRRSRRLLSPEQKWEIWLEVTTGELTQADAARKWGVDAGTVIRLRRDAKDACLTAFASSKPGRPSKARDEELERLRAENARLAEAVKELAVELTLVRGKSRWA
jgi:transposase-like protein